MSWWAIGAANTRLSLPGRQIGASLSKSAANDGVGARSLVSLVVAAAATILVALFLTPLFRDLPEASLAAIVVVAVAEMERIAPLTRFWRLRRSDFVLAMVAVAGVLVFDILPGLAIALVASRGVVVWRAFRARLHVIGEIGPTTPTVDIARSAVAPGLMVVRPEQMMFFVNATEIRDALVRAVGHEATAPDASTCSTPPWARRPPI